MKACPKCQTSKPETDFFKNARRKDGLQVWCKACLYAYRAEKKSAADWYERHKERERTRARARWQARDPEERKQYARERYAANRESCLETMRRYGQKMKLLAMDAYGGPVCACCAEDNPLFLSIDHVVPCGTKARAAQGGGSRLYRWLRDNGYPDGYQVLCFNCNLGRNVTRGECPHNLTPAGA